MYTHFCFSELLILRENKVRGLQKIFKKHHTRELHKKGYNFAPGAKNHTYF